VTGIGKVKTGLSKNLRKNMREDELNTENFLKVYEDWIPSNIIPLNGNRLLSDYIVESNKMIVDDIIMHHRSSMVFDLIDEVTNKTKILHENMENNIQKH